ncbi:molybdopterin cofactor-binding domain-containing protein [Streptosporangium sp. H16]|uniref:molybdopterin cofactor-binding domain-containing protein n=1 Tax=Streptosporangium sp. H16 TaxID=3444184 RepID=UPI003F79AA70
MASPNSGTGHRDKHYAVVHDCGKLINPMIVEGQIHGEVFCERLVHDGCGQPRPSSRSPRDHPAGRPWSRAVPNRTGPAGPAPGHASSGGRCRSLQRDKG